MDEEGLDDAVKDGVVVVALEIEFGKVTSGLGWLKIDERSR